MSTVIWVLGGLLAFWVAGAVLQTRGWLPRSVELHGPLVTLHTRRGRELLDRLAAPERFWRAWGNFGLGIALVIMAGSLVAIVAVAAANLQNPPAPSAINRPQNVLVIPGYNQFLPLSVAGEIVAGLVVGLIVHEGGHGILCRVEDIDIDSLGLLFLTVVPAGAFVQPDETSQENASRGGRARMFAAGVTNNFAVTAIALALLFGPVVGSLGVVSGATLSGAIAGSPAAAEGIDRGDVVVAIENRTVESNDDLDRVLREVEGRTVSVHLRGQSEPVEVERSVVVVSNASAVPGYERLGRGARIDSVNGTEVRTVGELERAAANRTLGTLGTAEGQTVGPVPLGAGVTVQPDGALADAGAPNGSLVVTRIAGERVVTADALGRVLDATEPGQTVAVEAYRGGQRQRYEVELGEHPTEDTGFLGVFVRPGIGGVAVNDFGAGTYPAGRYLSVLGGDCERCPDLGLDFLDRVRITLLLPVIGTAGSAAFPYNFPGFTGGIGSFYTVEGPLGALGGLVFLFANLLFWTGWINLNLAFFNCIPTFMLDGGHMFRAATEGVVARLPVERGWDLVGAATVSVQMLMLLGLLVALFAGQLLN
ncbi:MAG: site-2 protease family protein [Halobacteriaceae archaeon]